MEYEIILDLDNKDIDKLESHQCIEIVLGSSLCASFRKIKGISDAYSITVTHTLTHDVPYYQSLGTTDDLEKFIIGYTNRELKWEKVK